MNSKLILHIAGTVALSVAGLVAEEVITGKKLYPIAMEPAAVHVMFSPRGEITQRIVSEIDCAEKEIRLQAYSFTSRPVLAALIRAHERGVSVQVCVDDSNKNPDFSAVDELVAAGIPVRLDSAHPISHSKYTIIDKRLVMTGSWNFSKQADSNNENELIIQSKSLASAYLDNWQSHFDHSKQLDATCRNGGDPKSSGVPGATDWRPDFESTRAAKLGSAAVIADLSGRVGSRSARHGF